MASIGFKSLVDDRKHVKRRRLQLIEADGLGLVSYGIDGCSTQQIEDSTSNAVGHCKKILDKSAGRSSRSSHWYF